LLAIVVAAVILLCVGLVFIVRAIRDGGAAEEPTPTATATRLVLPTATMTLQPPTVTVPLPTATIALPTLEPTEPPPPPDTSGIEPGVRVVVKGVNPDGLNIRAKPTTNSKVLQTVTDTTVLTVLDGPEQGEGYNWWKVKSKKGTEGWVVGQYVELKQ
jgi:uncharacterized protein YgiM (DUF1202 family)